MRFGNFNRMTALKAAQYLFNRMSAEFLTGRCWTFRMKTVRILERMSAEFSRRLLHTLRTTERRQNYYTGGWQNFGRRVTEFWPEMTKKFTREL
jgi:hypothetical protein